VNIQEAKATASGAVEIYMNLAPTIKYAVARRFADELSLTYRIQSGELTSPKAGDRMAVECFFAILEEVMAVCARHFQRGLNSRQIMALVIDENVKATAEELRRLYPERFQHTKSDYVLAD
jgi:uncharacterized protein (DUF2132 family)